ncbi:MAG: SLATT domain-containing protein [Bacteroidota bacterium]
MSQPSEPHRLLEMWYRRAWIALNAHFDASRSRALIDLWLGGVAALLSAVVAALVGSTLVDAGDLDTALKWTIVVASAVAAGLTALSTKIEYGKKAASFRVAASGYQKVAGQIEQLVISGGAISGEDIEGIRTQIDEIESRAPAIPERFRKRYRDRYQPLQQKVQT